MTHDRMHARGVKNLLYAYSPGSEPKDSTAYLERYPGKSLILVGRAKILSPPEPTAGMLVPGTENNRYFCTFFRLQSIIL
jgi:hypothetical protein